MDPETPPEMQPSSPGVLPGEVRHDSASGVTLSREGTAVAEGQEARTDYDGDQSEREERAALRRIPSLRTELDDVTEVEYRQVRLERVVLIGQHSRGQATAAEVSLRELAALAETAGSQVLEGVLQARHKPDPATFVGSGKAMQISAIVAEHGADTVIVDADLAPSQRRALEDVVRVKVVDRTALILDIFAQHAKSKEGKAQVELAQLEYLLPRLRGWGDSLSRQAGGRAAGGVGIGGRGPGETKIELDRRRIRTRMATLRKQIRAMSTARKTRRNSRLSLPNVAIVGYTNAGKSSVLNRLTGAGVLVENSLFATLDPTVRRARTPDGRAFTIADTVGFVSELPHQLVAAFESTLEEAMHADLILHVVDASHPDPEAQIRAVNDVLSDIEGLNAIPTLIVLNKCDRASPEAIMALRAHHSNLVEISALTGDGIEELRHALEEALPVPEVRVEVTVPFSRGELVSHVHTHGRVLQEIHREEGTYLVAMVDARTAHRLREASVT